MQKIATYKNSPALAISLTVLISIIMVTTTTIIFYNSDAYQTVKQIQAGTKAVSSIDESVDTTSPIKATDIDEFSKSFQSRIRTIDDYTDFGPQALSNENLGL